MILTYRQASIQHSEWFGVMMADNPNDLMAEFQEFLTAKAEKEKEESAADDYDVEVWDEKGRGARVRRSHAKPFLQTLGIDLDAPEEKPEAGKDDKSKPKGKTAQSQSVARKYFTAPAKK
jgi:hypothetical protein